MADEDLDEEGVNMGGPLDASNAKKGIMDQDALFFVEQSGDADYSNETLRSLRIKDFADDQKQIQLKHPVCFTCFGEIIDHLDQKIKT